MIGPFSALAAPLPRRVPGALLDPAGPGVVEAEVRELAVLVIRDAIRACRSAAVAEAR